MPLFSLQRMPHMQDNDLEREFSVHRTESDYALAEFWKWVIACMIGVSMGCIGFAVDWGINLLQNAKYQTTASVLFSTGQPPNSAAADAAWVCTAALGLPPCH